MRVFSILSQHIVRTFRSTGTLKFTKSTFHAIFIYNTYATINIDSCQVRISSRHLLRNEDTYDNR